MNVHEVRGRLLQQRLRKVTHEAQGQLSGRLSSDSNAEMLLRLAGLTLTLLERHTTDAQGQCRVRGCSRRRGPVWRKSQPCQIFVTVQFWVEQPLRILQKLERRW